MPDFITHHIFGKNIATNQNLIPQAAAAIKQYPQSFIWGQQGPDPLFYHRTLLGANDVNTVGSEMHHLYTSQLMEEFARLILTAPLACKEMLFSYFCGFLCHYACDSVLHPYIYHWQHQIVADNPSLTPSGAHVFFESCMDSALYKHLTKKDITKFSFGTQYDLSIPEKNAIGWCYSNIIQTLYGKQVSIGQIESCFSQMLYFERLFYGNHPKLAKTVACGEKLIGRKGQGSGHFKLKDASPELDCLNLSKAAWENPFTGEVSYDSIFGLLKQAAQTAVSLIALYGQMITDNQIHFVKLPVTFCGELNL